MAAPLLAPIAIEIATIVAGNLLYDAVNNYIQKPLEINVRKKPKQGAPDIPVSKSNLNVSSKAAAQKKNLGDYALGISGLLAGASVTTKKAVTSGTDKANSISTGQSQKTSELAAVSQNSPLLTNQVYMKDSIDKLIDAINSNTLVSATVFGTLDANLSAIGASLTSIAGTLIDISVNYEQELLDLEDMPYMSQEELRRQLKAKGISDEQIAALFAKEDLLVSTLSKDGKDVSSIKQALLELRKAEIDAETQLELAKIQAGITVTAPNATTVANSPTSVSLEAPKLEAWAESQLGINNALSPDYVARELYARMLKNEFATNPVSIRDLNGNVVTTAKPMEVAAMKNATDAKLRTDMNNFELNESDLDLGFGDGFDISSIFQFMKKSDRLNEVLGAMQ